MAKDLKGRTAVITGSAQGIGLDVAKILAARGANVMVTDIQDPAKGSEIAQALASEFGVRTGYVKADVSNYEQMANLMKEASKLSDTGAIDILVNNAGIQHKAKTYEFPVEKWDQIIKINLSGVFYGMRAAADYMKLSDTGGRIFNIASVNGHVGSPEKPAYCAAKAGVVNMSRSAAVDFADLGVSVNSISPGFLDTPLARKQVTDFMAKENISEKDAELRVLEFHKRKEFIPVETIGHMVANMSALPKEEALRLSGQDMLIDYGWRENVYAKRPPEMGAKLVDEMARAPEQRQQGVA